ncbi:MAG TPA: hypothetical protein VGL38_06340 [bacterium]
MRPRWLLMIAAVIALGSSSLFSVALARRTGPASVPARIHFSSNFEGELEPCG